MDMCPQKYQKPTNLFLYIPNNSIHSPGMTKSLIYAPLYTYNIQNTCHDFIKMQNNYTNTVLHEDILKSGIDPTYFQHDVFMCVATTFSSGLKK